MISICPLKQSQKFRHKRGGVQIEHRPFISTVYDGTFTRLFYELVNACPVNTPV
jgi:hypothetical protein